MSWISYATIKQAEHSMARLLGEKGNSLLTVCESILRSGMRHEIGIRLQVLLEEMGKTSDIVFACVTMPDGTILAHTNSERLGEVLYVGNHEAGPQDMLGFSAQMQSQWRFVHLEGEDVFVVFRLFMPSVRQVARNLPIPIIFLGLNPAPFEVMRQQNRIYISILTGSSLLFFFASFSAYFFAQRAKESRKGQEKAEGLVRELEEEVRRREKLAAIGNLAAGVAHEIRNPLSSIKGYATYFGQRFPEGSSDQECAKVMVQEVDRLNSVITDLIGLSRPSDIHPVLCKIGDLLTRVALIIGKKAEAQRVVIKIYTAPALPARMLDPERMQQALLNLCLNAMHAMPQGGRLTLMARMRNGAVVLYVRDTGTGIAKEQLAHIFDPYFTTRSSGTGLGLALVAQIVEAHKATISVRSRLPNGKRTGATIFRITLPDKQSEAVLADLSAQK